MAVRTSDFDYELDESLIAQEPLPRRDQSRLMVLRRGGGELEHRVFADLPGLLRRGDVLVLNETAVIPARFVCRRASGGRIQGLFLREVRVGEWEVMLKGAGRCKAREELPLMAPGANEDPSRDAGSAVEGAMLLRRSEKHASAEDCGGMAPTAPALCLAENLSAGQWRVEVLPPAGAMEVLTRFGQSPLPPYIRRRGREREELDHARYQTVYAAVPGALAAPTAGLHFTPELLRQAEQAGARIVRVTLHVGQGTFLPVKVEDLSQHPMHSEWYELSASAADALNAVRREGRRIVAVGTTSLRVLETVAGKGRELDQAPDWVPCRPLSAGMHDQENEHGGEQRPPWHPSRDAPPFSACSGWTDLFVYPPHEFRGANALITNFHLPRSTLLMLVAAFCSPGSTDGIATIKAAYAEAQKLRYRFFSYGDAMLIE